MKTKRIMAFFFALVMVMGCMSLNPIASYADSNANGDVEINKSNFPDPNFRKYVKDNFDTNVSDDKLDQTELDRVTEINLYQRSVSSLQGIEFFKNLTKLDCTDDKLKRLDVSRNPNLTVLECSFNELTKLDVSNNTNLKKLNCDGNKLIRLNVTKNPKLTELFFDGNSLTSLDVSKNKELTKLFCFENKLTSLDLSKNKELTELWCYQNKLTSLDVSHNTQLTKLHCDKNNLTSLDLSKNKELTELDCSNQQYDIKVIKGTRKFEYSKFPGQFDKEKVTSLVGASFAQDALIVNSDDANKLTYNYNVGYNNTLMNVTLHVTYVDPENVVADVVAEFVAMYRLYNPYTHEHLFTTDAAEKDNLVTLGWNFEGIPGKVYMHGEKGGVYRLYNPTTGEHHYTTKEDEVAECVKAGWKNEGVKFFSVLDKDKQTVGMVSMYNPYEQKFYHHYTADADEIAKMVKAGWIKEEVKWYAAK